MRFKKNTEDPTVEPLLKPNPPKAPPRRSIVFGGISTVANALRPPKLSPVKDAEGADEGVGLVGATVNIVCDLAVVGFLPMGYSVVRSETGVMMAILLILFFLLLSGYTMLLLGKCAEATGATNYRQLSTKVLGGNAAVAIEVTMFLLCYMGCVFLMQFSAELFVAVWASCWDTVPFVFLEGRNSNIVTLSVAVLLPLCLLRSLKSLSKFSGIACLCLVYTLAFMGVRNLDGSYLPGGKYYSGTGVSTISPDLPVSSPRSLLTPSAITAKAADGRSSASYDIEAFQLSSTSLLFVSVLCIGYLAHYNALAYYASIKPTGPDRALVYSRSVYVSFSVTALFYMLTVYWSIDTFGSQVSSTVLASYSNQDSLAFVGRVGIAVSSCPTFAIMFFGLRASFLGLSQYDTRRTSKHLLVTLCLMLLVIGVALLVPDVGDMVAMTGAVLGCAVVYVIPPVLALALARDLVDQGDEAAGSAVLLVPWRFGPAVCMVVVYAGLAFAALGFYAIVTHDDSVGTFVSHMSM